MKLLVGLNNHMEKASLMKRITQVDSIAIQSLRSSSEKTKMEILTVVKIKMKESSSNRPTQSTLSGKRQCSKRKEAQLFRKMTLKRESEE